MGGLCVTVVVGSCGEPPRREPEPSHSPPAGASPAIAAARATQDPIPAVVPALIDVSTPWCPAPWHGLDEDTCWLAPDGEPSSLLLYLSGIVPPGPPGPLQATMQQVVARSAARAHAAVILPRGRPGLGPAATRSWWSWPTGAADVERLAPEMVRSWLTARTRLEAHLGAPFARTFLAGSSSGAYFLSALAVRGAIHVDGLAATSGGGAGRAALATAAWRPPFYVGFGSSDPAAPQLRAFGKALHDVGWRSRVGEHPGGHGAREVYLDEAFAFWSESSSKLP